MWKDDIIWIWGSLRKACVGGLDFLLFDCFRIVVNSSVIKWLEGIIKWLEGTLAYVNVLFIDELFEYSRNNGKKKK